VSVAGIVILFVSLSKAADCECIEKDKKRQFLWSVINLLEFSALEGTTSDSDETLNHYGE
jgi:hypothetical protein